MGFFFSVYKGYSPIKSEELLNIAFLFELYIDFSFDWNTKLSSIFGNNFRLNDQYLRSEMTIKDLLSHRTGLSDSDVYTGAQRIGRAEFVR